MIRKMLLPAAIAVGWLAYSQRNDIMRYLKIKQISEGDGHPGKVPAGGSHAYPAPGHGAPEGSGDFSSPGRGGPASGQEQ